MPVHRATVPRISFECASCAFSLVVGHLPVDDYSCGGKISCKAREEHCRSHLDPYIETLAATSMPANPLEYALAKNAPTNPLECAFTKSLDLKSPEMNTCRKYGGVPPACLLQCSLVKFLFTLCRFIVNRFSLPGRMDSPSRTASRDARQGANPQARDGARGAGRGESRKRRVSAHPGARRLCSGLGLKNLLDGPGGFFGRDTIGCG